MSVSDAPDAMRALDSVIQFGSIGMMSLAVALGKLIGPIEVYPIMPGEPDFDTLARSKWWAVCYGGPEMFVVSRGEASRCPGCKRGYLC